MNLNRKKSCTGKTPGRGGNKVNDHGKPNSMYFRRLISEILNYLEIRKKIFKTTEKAPKKAP